MSLAACAALVERADPDRYLATMAARPELRDRLWPLYAYSIEISRAPWVSAEPLVGAMRLQWWADTVAAMGPGGMPRAHEVAGPLADLVLEAGLPVTLLVEIAEARRCDLERVPFADAEAFSDYLDRTAGNLMWLAARALGAPSATEVAVRNAGWGAGLAAYLRAVPALVARGREALPDPRPDAIVGLARTGLARIALARAQAIPAVARPALWPGWQAETVLRRAAAQPERVAEGRLGSSDFRRRASLMLRVASGGW